MEIRKLTTSDRHLHETMSGIIVAGLPFREWLIPMTETEYEEAYRPDSTDIVYGMFENGAMIATCSMLNNVADYASEHELTDILHHNCVEIGECMVLPSHRGKGLMLQLNRLILDAAREIGVEYILATAHPDNISSNMSLQHLGLKLIKVFDRHGYTRNLYAMKI